MKASRTACGEEVGMRGRRGSVACGQAPSPARFAHDPRIKSGGRFSPRARGEVTMPRHSAPCR